MSTSRRFMMRFVAVLWLLSQTGCAAKEMWFCMPHGEEIEFESTLETCLTNEKNVFEFDSVRHPVYCFSTGGNKPPVMLLHELPGLSGKTLAYAKELSRDFTVYVPLLFGDPNKSSTLRGLSAFWFNREWWWLESGKSEIVEWLRHVVKEVDRLHSDQPIGIIGNCLTGSLPLALLDNKHIDAVVLAQPTLPMTIFFNGDEVRSSLGISGNEITEAKKSSAKIYYVRFEKDCVSKPEKKKTLEQFGDRVIDGEIQNSEELAVNAHSTLIGEWSVDGKPGQASRNAREEVRRFLLDPQYYRPRGKQ